MSNEVKNDVVVDGLDLLVKGVSQLEGRLNLLVGEIIRLHEDVKAIRDENKRVDKLVDRLIEMAMVTRGQVVEPFVPAKRATVEDDMDWGTPKAEDEWPPKGHASMMYP